MAVQRGCTAAARSRRDPELQLESNLRLSTTLGLKLCGSILCVQSVSDHQSTGWHAPYGLQSATRLFGTDSRSAYDQCASKPAEKHLHRIRNISERPVGTWHVCFRRLDARTPG